MAITIPANGYCAVSDVEAFVHDPAAFSVGTVPTLAQVESWITLYYSRMNAILRRLGYVTPMVMVGTQMAVTGSLVTNVLHSIGTQILRLAATSFSGRYSVGDLFLIAGDTQYYVCTAGVEADAVTTVDVEVSPGLLTAPAAGVAVTHTPSTNAADVLKELNALIVAGRVESQLASAGGDEASALGQSLMDEADKRWDEFRKGQIDIQGARRSGSTTPIGVVRLEVRG